MIRPYLQNGIDWLDDRHIARYRALYRSSSLPPSRGSGNAAPPPLTQQGAGARSDEPGAVNRASGGSHARAETPAPLTKTASGAPPRPVSAAPVRRDRRDTQSPLPHVGPTLRALRAVPILDAIAWGLIVAAPIVVWRLTR